MVIPGPASYNLSMKIGIAQTNPTVGDITGNLRQVLDHIASARRAGCDIVVFPELALCGYPPQDLLWRTGFVEALEQSLEDVIEAADGIAVVLGTVRREPCHDPINPHDPSARLDGGDAVLHNSALVVRDRCIVAEHRKVELPTFDVFSEQRYFESGSEADVFVLGGKLGAFGVNVCEDFWADDGPTDKQAVRGARWIINLSASPYYTGKPAIRRAIAKRRVADNGVGFVYVNRVGGQDDLVFDGGSFIIGPGGRTLFQAPSFEDGLFVADIEEGPSVEPGFASSHPSDEVREIRSALVLGIRDYVRKNGFTRVLLGLSGGVDSAVTAALAVEALGQDHVSAAYLPSRYSSEESAAAARQLADALGIELVEISIASLHAATAAAMPTAPSGLVDENIQPRLRGMLLMALANQRHALVLCPANKAEIAVGYSTLYGDSVGALAPIGDLYKRQVFAVAESYPEIPASVIQRPPTAELRAEQRDDQDLPPYTVLDPLLHALIEQNRSRQQLIEQGFATDLVDDVLRRYYLAEYKRRQLPPAIKVSAKAFGSGRRFPITHRYRT